MPAPEKENEKDPSAALGMTIRKGLPHFFIPLRKPASAPSGHLLPGEGGSMPPSRIVISSESEKSFSFAVKNRGEERDHGKHRTPCSAGCRYVKGLSRIPFHPAARANLRPFGAPPSGGRRECAAFPHRHFERKREIFFVCGQESAVRRGDHGKLHAPCDLGKGGSVPPPRPFFSI